MIEKDYIKELFQDKLTSHEVPVRADLWTSVSSSIGGSSVVATSMSIATKIIIAVSVSAVAFVTFYLVNDKTSAPTPFKKEHPQEQKIIPVDTLKIEKEEVKKEEKLLPKQAEQRVDCEYDFSTPENDSDLKSDFHKSNINKEIVTEKGPQKIEQQDPIIRNNSTSTSEIVANPELTTKEQESTVLLPNIFTPNGDGKNDGLAKNGEISPAGTYVYYISAKDLNGKLLTKYSSLTISY
ncbi:MAG: hypothetical protein EBU61_01940 [Crocinitomicaceae bacterium]|nr:hypothetical protein [Crocinitomicaceae bacterium]